MSRLSLLQGGDPEEDLPPNGDPYGPPTPPGHTPPGGGGGGHGIPPGLAPHRDPYTQNPPIPAGYDNTDRALTYDRSTGRGPYDPRRRSPYEIPLIPEIGINGAGMQGVNMDDFTAVTREVQPEELTSYQLQSLLAGDSLYMQQARQRGIEQAAEAGAFGSSMMAESAMRAAIDRGAPIAQADAQAYIQAASENLQVVNANINTKLQAATSIANNMNTNRANMAIADLRARTQQAIAQAEIESRFALQEQSFGHSVLMEELMQTGRLELANLNADLQERLQQMGFQNAIELSELSHAQRMELEEVFIQPRFQADHQLQRAGLESNMIMSVMQTYAQFVNNLNGQDLDQAAYQRGMDMINNWVSTTFDALGMVDFNFSFGSTGDGSSGDPYAVPAPPGGG